jgi:hypothetical protein
VLVRLVTFMEWTGVGPCLVTFMEWTGVGPFSDFYGVDWCWSV